MPNRIHKNARTTPKTRQEIQASDETNAQLAQKYGVDIATIRKWRGRDFIIDAPVIQRKTRFSFNPWQEYLIVQFRCYLYLGLDDLLTITNEYIKPDTSRSALSRLLKKHHISKMQNILPIPDNKTHGEHLKKSSFGTMQVTIIPKLSTNNGYLFLAYEHRSRYLFCDLVNKKEISTWLKHCIKCSPLTIQHLLLDALALTYGSELYQTLSAIEIPYTVCTITRPEINVPNVPKLKKSHLKTMTQIFNHHIPLHALGNITPFAQCIALQQSGVPSNQKSIANISDNSPPIEDTTLRIKKYVDSICISYYDAHTEQLNTKILPKTQNGERKMANANETVTELMGTEGAIAAIIADSDSGLVLAAKSNGFDTDTAAAGNTRVMQAKRDTMKMLKLDDSIQDILITLGNQLHLITPLPKNDAIFGYLVVDKSGANLGMARAQLKNAMASLAV
ncbi:MAG: hypothetical protein Q9M75_03455 [Ghiorsea sp.]|nr:hypothetical protein [Ghiorsea sp.]